MKDKNEKYNTFTRTLEKYNSFFIHSHRTRQCLGLTVTSSLSRPHHHKGRIPQWAQESPSSPYVRRGNVLKPCGDFFDQSYVEGSRRLWRSLHNCIRCWKCPHLCRRVWNNVEEYGRPWNMGEYSRNFNGSLVTTCT